jgi:hypothetical protein
MSITPTNQTDIHLLVAQMVNLGHSDPLEIAQTLIDRNREDLVDLLMPWAEDFIRDMARRQLGAVRRSAELQLRPGDQLASSQLKIAKAWVPGLGYKVAAQLTVDDLEARASWYENFAHASLRRAVWCREVAGLMRGEGARTLGKLKVALPPLPDSEIAELTA